jgi:hypothetical protein
MPSFISTLATSSAHLILLDPVILIKRLELAGPSLSMLVVRGDRSYEQIQTMAAVCDSGK